MNDEVLILGGGPSLEGFDFDVLRGHHTIAVNYSIFSAPFAAYFVTLDRSFFDKIVPRHVEFNKTAATKIFVNNLSHAMRGDARELLVGRGKRFDFSTFSMIVRSTRADGIGRSFLDFRHGYNSGYCALQLAVLLGYKRIRLVGIDLGFRGKKTHYHDAYRINRNCLEAYTQYFLGGIRDLKERWPGVEIISHSPISPLNEVVRYEPFVPSSRGHAHAPECRLDWPESLGRSIASTEPLSPVCARSLPARFFRACRRLLRGLK